jgi:hypothetical protein
MGIFLDVLLTVHHGKLSNQHQLDTLFLVCLLGVNVSIYFGRYSPFFRKLWSDAVRCNYVRRICVDYVQVVVEQQHARSQHTSYARNYTEQYLCRAS